MTALFSKTVSSPVGFLILESSETALKSIRFSKVPYEPSKIVPDILKETETQLNEYFSGERFDFNLKLEPEGTEFRKRVWELLRAIPYGETTTYKALALKLGSSAYTRAVGLANGSNPIAVVIPCHRVIGEGGRLVGYAGGIERKKQLLLHELDHLKKGLLF